MSKANISALLYKGAITKDRYIELYNMSKIQREITIGLMERRNPKISQLKKEGIEEARRLLVESNNLEDSDILEIRNDALFIVNNELQYTKFDMIDFKLKNVYNLYLFVSKQLQIYYRFDTIHNVDVIDIKGIKEQTQELHRDYFISFLCNVFYSLQNESVEKSIEYITSFYQQYIKLELEVGYYREFNSESVFRVSNPRIGVDYGFYNMSENDKNQINIDYNLFIIKTIYQYITGIYFGKKK